MKRLIKTALLINILSIIAVVAFAQKPNIVFILTDDQGYGDLRCHGNPLINTPNLDKLHAQSIRFTDFHVATTCAPSRAGLLTGKNCNKVGVWHTILGRQILRKEEVTMAEIFKEAGYVTGIFGKWHLGDNYPFRPQDRGFDEVLIHGGGGITQTPDYWGNDYFDDTYFHNGEAKKYKGYCNDVWFNEASRFIEKNKAKPFFCYIPTNSPHSPYHVADTYSDPYKNNPSIPNPNFYGMITNIDERVGLLIEKLKKEGVYENTIFIFMTDNGTAAGAEFNKNGELLAGFNTGMRAKKGSPYDGGHRVPFFLHWPKAGYTKGRDISALTSYTDVLPTLMDVCQISYAKPIAFDGMSLMPLLKGNNKNWNERVIVVDTQRDEFLVKGKQSSVMTKQWRLVNGNELYDIQKDKGQKLNVASKHPQVVAKLTEEYEKWWVEASRNAQAYSRIIIGSPYEKITRLTSHDLHAEREYPAWNQQMVREGKGVNGFWALQVAKAGNYEIQLRRYPIESGLSLSAIAPKGEEVPGGKPYPEGKPLSIKKVKIQLGSTSLEKEVRGDEKGCTFTVTLQEGDIELRTYMLDEEDQERCAYYIYIKPL